MKRPTLYLETTIPSYYTSRPSRDVIVLAHQEITRIWWEKRLPLFDIYISPVVIEEARRGDQDLARKRLDIISEFPILETTSDIESLAEKYIKGLVLPAKSVRDAAHLAFACRYGVDFLLTWNCTHIANAEIRNRVMRINSESGLQTPIICTPEELMGTEEC